jgi:peptidoglycan/xylan/chitin deacetylase (PgdA/CDA1 family)
MSKKFYNLPTFEQTLNRLVGPFVTIFTIHRAQPSNSAYSGLDEQLLERCLDYATKKNYAFASIDQIVEDALKGNTSQQPTLCFTLDDGYVDQAERLLPLLLDYKTSPTLFVITDFIDRKMWPWDAKITHLIWNTPLQFCALTIGNTKLEIDLSTPEKRVIARRQVIQAVKRFDPGGHAETIEAIADACQLTLPSTIPKEFTAVTWQQLRDLETQGLRVGSHTRSHIVFNSSSDELIQNELQESRLTLQTELSSPSSVFCYPLGTRQDFSPRHTQLVKAAGYTSAISTISNITTFADIRKDPFQIQRIGFPNTFEKFVRYTSWREVIRGKLPF